MAMNDLNERILSEPQAAAPDTLKEISRIATSAVHMERMIQIGEEELDKLRKQLNEMRFDLLPGLMLEAGLSSFRLTDNSTVRVEDYIQGSLPKDPIQRSAAIIVLEQAGGEALIKNDVVASFERKQHNAALALAQDLQAKGLDVHVEQDVHHSTLKAFVREKLKRGEQLEYEKLGIFVGRRAVIKPAGEEA
jgi:sulfur transfer complex TusBCD TusB component (DsrH family)